MVHCLEVQLVLEEVEEVEEVEEPLEAALAC
jgi:hypothetical protein